MAGHSQFKNIMHRKGRQDVLRSKLFSKLSREITVAARMGGPDPDGNPRLRLAIQNARAQSMPKENVERAIGKSQTGEADHYEEIRYEGYGPKGVAIIVEALSDNRNRTASVVRAIFAKYGGNLGEIGSVAFLFDRRGEIIYRADTGDDETILDAAISAGANDVNSNDDNHIILCAFENLNEVASALETSLGRPGSARIVWTPRSPVTVSKEGANALMKLVAALEEDHDVQTVYANFEMSDAIMARLAAATP